MAKTKINKRDSMVERFEEIVKQEIVNHNNQITATNKMLNSLQEGFSTLSSQLAKMVASQESKFLKMTALFTRNEQDITKFYNRCKLGLEGLDGKQAIETFNREHSIDNLNDTMLDKSDFIEHVDLIRVTLNEFGSCIADQKIYLTSTLSTIRQELDKSMEAFIEELNSRPSEFIEIREDLEKRLSECKVDTAGVDKKLQVYNKSIFILERKIEHIYTLIGRNIKGGKF